MLKYMIETLDGLDPAIAPMYEKTEDNKFRLNVEGAVPREKLDEFRNKNIDLMKQLEGFKGVDIEKYKNLLGIEKKLTDKELIDAGKVDEVVQSRIKTMQTEHTTQVENLMSQLTTSNRQLESLLVDSAVRVKALEFGVLPSAVDDVMLRAKTAFKIIDGVATPQQDGKTVYGKDGVNPMSVDEWIGQLTKTAPHLFGSTAGGGAPPRVPGGRQQQTKNLTPTQKIAAGLNAGK